MSAKGRIVSEVEIISRRKEQARSFQEHDCNNCSRRDCNAGVVRFSRAPEKDYWRPVKAVCKGRVVQDQRFQLAELSAEHPQGLINTALSLKNFRPAVEIRLDRLLKAS